MAEALLDFSNDDFRIGGGTFLVEMLHVLKIFLVKREALQVFVVVEIDMVLLEQCLYFLRASGIFPVVIGTGHEYHLYPVMLGVLDEFFQITVFQGVNLFLYLDFVEMVDFAL